MEAEAKPNTSLEQIRKFDREALIALWKRLRADDVSEFPAGSAFEWLILRAFELDGATIAWPFRVTLHDEIVEQIDGAVYVQSLSCIVEAKDWRTPVTIATIAKLRNQLLRRPASVTGLVMTSGQFSAPALELARFVFPQTILLWTGRDVEEALINSQLGFVGALHKKYRHAVEYGDPSHDIFFK